MKSGRYVLCVRGTPARVHDREEEVDERVEDVRRGRAERRGRDALGREGGEESLEGPRRGEGGLVVGRRVGDPLDRLAQGDVVPHLEEVLHAARRKEAAVLFAHARKAWREELVRKVRRVGVLGDEARQGQVQPVGARAVGGSQRPSDALRPATNVGHARRRALEEPELLEGIDGVSSGQDATQTART